MSRRVPSYGPKPDLTHAERVARLEALVEAVGKELDLIIPGDWKVTLEFPSPSESAHNRRDADGHPH